MNTRQLLLTFFLVIIFISCKSDKKTEALQKTPTKTEKVSSDRQNITNTYKPIQNTKEVNQPNTYTKHLLSDTENYYKVSEDKIHVEIPVSDKNMKIENVINVSNYNQGGTNYNAIIIHLTNNVTTNTNEKVTHKIISDLKISKINGLKKNILSDPLHELKVYIINEDELDTNEVRAFIECAKKETNYKSHLECDLDNSTLYEKDTTQPFRPREQEGDIIIGG